MSKLIGQGGFGCVYHPAITCSGNVSKNKKFVSKLHVYDNDFKKEVNFGKIIKQIKNYKQFFSPIVKTCPVNLNAIDKKNIGDCQIVDKHSDLEFMLSYIPYIHGPNLDKYIIGFKNHDFFISLINTYSFLINSLKILNKNDIIHFDIKGENIIYDSSGPIIIDFGLSFKISDIISSNIIELRKYFYTYAPSYYIWSPEIHIIAYIVKNAGLGTSDILFTPDTLNDLLDDIVSNNDILEIFSDDFKISYHKSLYNYMKQFINKPDIFIISELIKYNNTWDMYSLSILYLKVINKRVSERDVSDNSIYNILSQLFLLNINPDPRKRHAFETTKRLLYRLFPFSDDDFDHRDDLDNDIIEFTLNSNEEMLFKSKILPHLKMY